MQSYEMEYMRKRKQKIELEIPFTDRQELLLVTDNPAALKTSRPPKHWFDKTVRKLSKRDDVDDPEALAAWIWFYQMTDAQRHALIREQRTRQHD